MLHGLACNLHINNAMFQGFYTIVLHSKMIYALILLGNTNEYVLVTADSTGRITCTFLNQQDSQMEKSCSVFYGQCAEQLSYSSTFHATDDSITVQLNNVIESDLQDYCYATIANNGTFSVLIEGSFSSTVVTLSK